MGVRLGGLSLALTYDSTALVPRTPTALAGSSRTEVLSHSPVAKYWSANLFKRVAISTVRSGGSIPAAAAASRGNGTTITFSRDVSTGQDAPDGNNADTLVELSDGRLRYFDKASGAEETYDSSGALTSIAWADGQRVDLTYSTAATPASIAPGPGYVIQAVDQSSRGISFIYAARTSPLAGGRLARVTDPASQIITLDNNESTGDLSAIHWSDGRVRTFLYEGNTVGALTGVTDELGQRYATFGYDANWRAISTEHAGGVDKVSVVYTTPPSVLITEVYDSTAQAVFHYQDWSLPQGVVVMDALGTQSRWSATSLLNKNYLTGQSQAAGSGCAASTNAQSYDANGNVASADDFSGARSCFVSDLSRNVETTRVEGLGNTATCTSYTASGATLPAGSRKTSTVWHPDWRLQAKVAEPGRLTTKVYNGQPDPFNANAVASCAPSTALLPDGKPIVVLCKQVEQATTDASGSQGFSATLQSGVANRVRSWTYNQYGQVLTDKDALNNTTTYAYYGDTSFTGADPNAVGHTLGDLQTLTNAKGQVTTYTKYDKYGNVLESVDANGVTTTNAYDLRQRLLSTSVGGQTTSYEYDAAGQLLKVTAPDGSWIGYEYDAAHRRVATKDNLENRIEYTLDNAGNVTAQNTKDPGGALARTLARSIDALGRVQQATGRE